MFWGLWRREPTPALRATPAWVDFDVSRQTSARFSERCFKSQA
jgi:hypothetical protein